MREFPRQPAPGEREAYPSGYLGFESFWEHLTFWQLKLLAGIFATDKHLQIRPFVDLQLCRAMLH